MLLHELAAHSGVSAATIKYYRREGLLPPGTALTTTRFDYGQPHLERLALIRTLREVAQAGVADIKVLLARVDDPACSLLTCLETAQAVAAGIPAADVTPPVGTDEDPLVAQLLAEVGWADAATLPRHALDRLVRSMRSEGVPVDLTLLQRYARAMAEVARGDLDALATTLPGGGVTQPPSRDVVLNRAVVGMVRYEQLVATLRSLALASLSIAAERGQPD